MIIFFQLITIVMLGLIIRNVSSSLYYQRKRMNAIQDQLDIVSKRSVQSAHDIINIQGRLLLTDSNIDTIKEIVGTHMAAKGKDDKAPNTGSNSTQKRDDKMTTTDKSKDPNRPHKDR